MLCHVTLTINVIPETPCSFRECILSLYLSVGKRKASKGPSGTDRRRTYWTPPMDRYLIDLLLEHVHKGNKLGQTFISQAWIEMATSFNQNFKSNYDKEVLKNRYKHLRRQYSDIKNLLERTEFSWDEACEMVKAEDHVWDAYIKVDCFSHSVFCTFWLLALIWFLSYTS